jgi:hypothetical protein
VEVVMRVRVAEDEPVLAEFIAGYRMRGELP